MACFFTIKGEENQIVNLKLSTMKKALLFISLIALGFAACTSKTNADLSKVVAQPDTTGFAAFQDWKFQNERMNISELSQPVAAAQPVAAVTHKKTSAARKVSKPAASPVVNNNSGSNDGNSGAGTGTEENKDNGTTGTVGSETTNPAKEEKKGISNAAKGTAIGAAGGAVLGAVIYKKNPVLGGVIGGVIGGGVGYGIGRKIDKKQGR